MKNLTILAALVLFMCSCGPNKEDIKKVCDCETLYSKMKDAEGELQINDNINSNEAQKKVAAQNQEAYDACVKLSKSLGDDIYAQTAKDCAAK
jgi:hypothetical protein